jgi:hypothetical protein
MTAHTLATATSRSENTSRFYERILDEGLKSSSSNWPSHGAHHNFALAFGEGVNFRKHFFYIEAKHIERFVQLAIECGIGDEILDRNTTSSVDADVFPSLRCDRLGWRLHEDEIPPFPSQVTLRQFLLARQFDVPPAYSVADVLTRDLYRRGIAIPQAVAELELARVNFNRKLETEPYILEENVSQRMQRAYGSKPKNEAGQPCNELSESKKQKLYARRFMHRFSIGSGLYLPAAPERVVAMLSVLDETIADGLDVSFLFRFASSASTDRPLQQFLQCNVTDLKAARKFPSQDVHCLKWQQSDCAPSKDDESKISLGRWLELQGYLQAGWDENSSGSLKAMLR